MSGGGDGEALGAAVGAAQRQFAAQALGDADVGALLGWGFPAWTGGPLSLIDQVGSAAFVRRCDALADKYGARFAVPDQLREMAAKNGAYYQTVSVRT